ncbi:MAG: ABC transporter permease [Deltaproteobacteria bacterium]|jgi:ABC-type spermidine/putrescine transport system permease subunit I|nr:ABC transporter permease [Deltaproteobacteria bacterium]
MDAKKWRERQLKESTLGLGMMLPSFGVMLLIVFFPIGEAFITSVKDSQGQFTLTYYRQIFNDPYYSTNIFFTLRIMIFTMVLTLIFSYLIALYTTFVKSTLSRAVGLLCIFTRFVPGIAVVYGLMTILKDTGTLNRFFAQLGSNFDPGLLYTAPGLIFLNVWFNVPFAAMIIGSSLVTINPSLLESARDVGAGFRGIFFELVWPLSYKAALLAAVLVLMNTASAFTIPFLAGPNFPKMLGVALYQEFKVFYNPAMACALSVVMFAISSLGGFVYIYVQMKKDVWR